MENIFQIAGSRYYGRGILWYTNIVALILFYNFFSLAFADNCMDCHSGTKTPNAPKILLADTSVHKNLECGECHLQVEVPHPKNMPLVQCKICHQDEAKTVGSSSHSKRMAELLSKNASFKPSTLCLVCHGNDPHNIESQQNKSSNTYKVNIASTCLKCHDHVQPIAISKYRDSVHGKAIAQGNTKAATCIDCHGSHTIDHSSLPASSASRNNIPQTCGECHPDASSEYMQSIHWDVAKKGFKEAPVCNDCHGEHGIRSLNDPTSYVWAGNITKTCSSCHQSLKLSSKFNLPSDRVESFNDSFHGLSNSLGDLKVANCSSCHGNHKILPSSDTRSSVNPENLSKTCSKCHPGAEKRFISEKVHISTQKPSHWSVAFVRTLYIWLIVFTIGCMFIYNLFDLIYKSTVGNPFKRIEKLIPRFSVNERVQHIILAICFINLAGSGFALAFPGSLFALPYKLIPVGIETRRWVHRISALVFLVLSIYHVLYLMFAKRGREQLKALFPRLRDIRDAKDIMIMYLKRARGQKTLEHYCFIEKSEYWALVWGTIIMTLTGVILYFNSAALASMPLWVIDLMTTIHFWEAVLATLAIVVWHFYWSIFDPEIYPMNPTWLLGNHKHKANEVS